MTIFSVSSRNGHEEIYKKYLNVVDGIKFTPRECDVLSGIISTRGDKKIAAICSISPKTVSVHVYNIMNKLRCNSKEQIIDFIEKAGVAKLFRECYSHLMARYYFDVALSKIAKTLPKESICCSIEPSLEEESLYKEVVEDLNIAGIKLVHFKKPEQYKILDLSKMKSESYYEDLLSAVAMAYNQELESIISEFISNISAVKKLSGNVIVITPSNKDKTFLQNLVVALMERPKSFTVAGIVLIFILGIAFELYLNLVSQHTFDNKAMQAAINDLHSFVAIAKSNTFTANNLDKEQVSKNQSIIKRVESLSNCRNRKSVQQYLLNGDTPHELILNYIHAIQALASYYMYNEHDGIKSKEILLHAKKVTEVYLNKRNKKPVDFDNLKPEEILPELQIIKGFPEMYTRVVYSLGRTSIYNKQYEDGKKCFEITKYLGQELGLFEGYLSVSAGILAIEMQKTLDMKNPVAEIERLKWLLSSFEAVQRDNKLYILDYNPNIQEQQTINPSTHKHNVLHCQSSILNIYSNLILVDDHKKIADYDKIVARIAVEALANLASAAPRKRSFFYNSVGANILALFDRGYANSKITEVAAKIVNKKSGNDLDIAFELYELSKSSSREVDYTKADAYDGAVKVLERKAKFLDKSSEELKQLVEEKKNYESSRDAINKTLDRVNNLY